MFTSHRTLTAALAALLAGTTVAVSQPGPPAITIDPMIVEFDFLPGMGLVVQINRFAVNDNGDWLAEVTTDHVDPSRDSAILLNGQVLYREGDPFLPISGANFADFAVTSLTNDKKPGLQAFFNGLATTADSGIVLDGRLVQREGLVSVAPQFAPGTVYRGFHHAVFGGPERAVVLATLDDPQTPVRLDRAVIKLTLDSSGSLLSESVIARIGEPIAGLGPIAGFDTSRHSLATNVSGNAIYIANLNESVTPERAVLLDSALLAHTGEVSPVVGDNWGPLRTASVDLNDSSDYALLGDLESGRRVLVSNGSLIALEGDPVVAANGAPLIAMPTHGPVLINNSGDVLWWGHWESVDLDKDSGLMLNDWLLVQEGVTQLLRQRVDDVMTGEGSIAMSDNGRFVAFKARLDLSGFTGIFLMRLELCYADCDQSTGVGTLDIFDFLCFQNSFVNSEPYACDCDTSTGQLVCDVFDFLCFQNAFVSGCP
jgi:hypothetical protein